MPEASSVLYIWKDTMVTVIPHSYSENIVHQRIGIIGPYPPPLGGISVHIQRVAHKLIQQHNNVHIFDATRYKSRITRWKKIIHFLHNRAADHIHYHTLYHGSIEWLLVVMGQILYGYKLTLIDHDCRNLYTRSAIFKYIVKITLSRVHEQILIGTTTHQAYLDNHIPCIKNMKIESAFLPPDLTKKDAIIATYPAELWIFLNNHIPLICMNAFSLVLLHTKDLYGVDTALELIHRLKKKHPHIGLVCALAQIGDDQHFKKIMHFITEHNLHESVFFLHGQKELWPLLVYTDIFIRPTLSDGFSVSIEEALYFNITTIATDTAARPASVIVYPVHDINAGESVIQHVLHAKGFDYTSMQLHNKKHMLPPMPPMHQQSVTEE